MISAVSNLVDLVRGHTPGLLLEALGRVNGEVLHPPGPSFAVREASRSQDLGDGGNGEKGLSDLRSGTSGCHTPYHVALPIDL
jgi:hypothetical protein